MKHEIKLIREIEDLCDDVPSQKIEMTVSGDATMYEMISQFECFLKACTYPVPNGKHLEFVDNE